MIAGTSRATQGGSEAVRGEPRGETDLIDKRLQFSIAPDEPYIDQSRKRRRPRPLRKQRREGRWVFLLLLVAFAFAVIWLVTHLPF